MAGDEGDALAGVGPVAELKLGGVPAGQGDGVVDELLCPLRGRAGHLQVHTRESGGADFGGD